MREAMVLNAVDEEQIGAWEDAVHTVAMSRGVTQKISWHAMQINQLALALRAEADVLAALEEDDIRIEDLVSDPQGRGQQAIEQLCRAAREWRELSNTTRYKHFNQLLRDEYFDSERDAGVAQDCFDADVAIQQVCCAR